MYNSECQRRINHFFCVLWSFCLLECLPPLWNHYRDHITSYIYHPKLHFTYFLCFCFALNLTLAGKCSIYVRGCVIMCLQQNIIAFPTSCHEILSITFAMALHYVRIGKCSAQATIVICGRAYVCSISCSPYYSVLPCNYDNVHNLFLLHMLIL